jgi:hypothetical protein
LEGFEYHAFFGWWDLKRVLVGADDMYVMSVSQLKVAVEFVGKAEVEERQKNLKALQVATLNYAGVCSAGPPGELRSACSSISPSQFHLVTKLYFNHFR